MSMTREEQIKHAWFCKACLSSHCYDEKSFKEAAKWAYKTMIDKACEWLKNSLYDTQDNCGYKVVASFDSVDVNEFIEQFKRAMEE